MSDVAADLLAIERMLTRIPPEKLAEMEKIPAIASKLSKWRPSKGPQTMAYNSLADVMLYGGQAGGGKSGLIIGLCLTAHKRALVMRRQYSDLSSMIEDMLEKNGTRDGFNGSPPAKLRTHDGRLIEFGGAKTPGDERHFKGQPHDLLAIDEASQFQEQQVRFLMGWVRSTDPKQRTRVVLATNPPESETEGQWLKQMFGPWLDPSHPLFIRGIDPMHPTLGRMPGELLWVISDEEGKDRWVDGPEPVQIGEKTVQPTSRTFIPARLEDNPYFWDENGQSTYQQKLDALPEPLRSAVRDGDWTITMEQDPYQVIPTAWIMAAQDRWEANGYINQSMSAMGFDCAGGGDDAAVLAYRYGMWIAPLIRKTGAETADGIAMATMIMEARRDNAALVIDVGGGYAGSVIERLRDNGIDYYKFNGASGSAATAKGSGLRFYNRRAEAWWKMREALDPDQEGGSIVALPPDSTLRADLAAPRWEPTPKGIKIEAKEDIKKRIGRSPDAGDAAVMCLIEGIKAAARSPERRSRQQDAEGDPRPRCVKAVHPDRTIQEVAMAGSAKTPDIPKPTVTRMPVAEDPNAKKAAEEYRNRRMEAATRRSTILSENLRSMTGSSGGNLGAGGT